MEKYLHAAVKKSRNVFLKKHSQKKTRIVFLDIPLLFENKLENICNYTILFYAPLKTRKQRAIRRRGMQKGTLEKIIKSQLSDVVKKKKADFIINTSLSQNQCFNKISKIIDIIKDK
ncbi:dephospho-CoA kinase [Alphaproteobacteria bacterium]|nr:dephospho-CoA kinase [Alphaproteobacteria bacterium]